MLVMLHTEVIHSILARHRLPCALCAGLKAPFTVSVGVGRSITGELTASQRERKERRIERIRASLKSTTGKPEPDFDGSLWWATCTLVRRTTVRRHRNFLRTRPMGCQHVGIFYERSQWGADTSHLPVVSLWWILAPVVARLLAQTSRPHTNPDRAVRVLWPSGTLVQPKSGRGRGARGAVGRTCSGG
eukprot:5374929-Pyramimonas_sp.AAC.1